MKRRDLLGGLASMGILGSLGRRDESANQEALKEARDRILKHRRSQVRLILRTRDGRPLPNAKVRLSQVRHRFLFGCNIFLWGRVGQHDLEEAYRERFASVFNYATLPFYWAFYEPQKGRPIYDETDRVVEWCQRHEITCKGHPLVWDHQASSPQWLPDDVEEVRSLSLKRVREIVHRFQGRIDIWDVVNEPTDLTRFPTTMNRLARKMGAVPFTIESLKTARQASGQAILLVNDYRTDDAYYAILVSLKQNGAPFDAVGIQSHMHGGVWPTDRIWAVCEQFARLGLPLHFTETTILSGKRAGDQWEESTKEGEEWQAGETERFYTVLFSHPAVFAITWWDFADRGAWMGAPAGWLRKDLSPKPVYEKMRELIRRQWWSSVEGHTGPDGTMDAALFKGHYEVTIRIDSGQVVQRELDTGDGPVVQRVVEI